MAKQIIILFIFLTFLNPTRGTFSHYYWNQTGLIFDENFITINRNNFSEKIFEYNKENICVLSKSNNFIHVSLKSINQYFATIPQRAIPSYLEVHACFSYKDRSYIWAKDPNSISVSELFSLPNKNRLLALAFDLLRFDIVSHKFLIYRNGDILIFNFNTFLQNPNCRYEEIIITNLTCTDIRFINEKIYCLHNKTIFKLNSNNSKYYSPYFTDHFQFLLVPYEADDNSNISNFNYNSHLFLYLIDLFVIIMIIFIFRNRLIVKSRFGNIRYSPPPIIKELTEIKNEKIELMIS